MLKCFVADTTAKQTVGGVKLGVCKRRVHRSAISVNDYIRTASSRL